MPQIENYRDPVWKQSVSVLKGVGPAIEKKMVQKGLCTVDDLLYFVPIRWLDRSTMKKIGELKTGDECSVLATVDSYRSMFFRN